MFSRSRTVNTLPTRRATINHRPFDREEILDELETRLSRDMNFSGGRILGSMCSAPHPLAAEVYLRYLEKNIGDPGLVPALMDLEKEAISMIGSFLSNPGAPGRIVTGGTEANLLALWTAKKRCTEGKRKVLVSEAAHFSFEKAASLMNLELVRIPCREDHVVDTQALEKAIDSQTMALVGIAGTTSLGLCDDIETLSQIALGHGVYLHVDASFGGFVLPFLENSGYPTRAFDFSLPGVSSISLDPHKMGRGPIPSGAILYRNEELAETVNTSVQYLSGGRTRLNTIVGTRSGASAAAVWAVLRHLGHQGYAQVVKKAMDLTHFLKEEILKLPGMEVVVHPLLNVLGIRSRNLAPSVLAAQLRSRGWALSEWNDFLRIVLMPHVSKGALKEFLVDLETILGEVQNG